MNDFSGRGLAFSPATTSSGVHAMSESPPPAAT
jgi:hypothetical protein